MTRIFVDEIDEETNMPKKEKRLFSVLTMNSGEQFGSIWTFTLNGIKIYQKDVRKQECIVFVQNQR